MGIKNSKYKCKKWSL